MLAIVETCGKQYQLQEGRYVDVEYLVVVMIVAGENSLVGQPYIEGAKIAGTVMLNSKNQKVIVYKQRCKKGYRKKQGHRQMFSRVMIDSIVFPGKEDMPADEKPAKAKKATTKKADAAEKTVTKKAATKKATEEKVEEVAETKAEANE